MSLKDTLIDSAIQAGIEILKGLVEERRVKPTKVRPTRQKRPKK